MLEIFLKERGQVPYLRQAFGLLDSYILGELSFGDGGKTNGDKISSTVIYTPQIVCHFSMFLVNVLVYFFR